MTVGEIGRLRQWYHQRLFETVLRVNGVDKPNNADGSSPASVGIGRGIIERIGATPVRGHIAGQTAGQKFEEATRDFLRNAFALLHHLRPGTWEFSLGERIEVFEQYQHLADITRLIHHHIELRTAFGDYIIKPDIVVCREPVADDVINADKRLVGDPKIAIYTPLRQSNSNQRILHASVSCKWTIRSDRSQNARTEGLNLIRNRKGRAPHVAVVTAEPLPTRIASLALGTGDVDCVYHFALPELIGATEDNGPHGEMLATLVSGHRLRDIADLPFDLAT